jgi:hypothetical protein
MEDAGGRLAADGVFIGVNRETSQSFQPSNCIGWPKTNVCGLV